MPGTSAAWGEAFAGMEIVYANGRTDLVGELDQAALFGLLARVQALAQELLEVRREVEPLTVTSAGMVFEPASA